MENKNSVLLFGDYGTEVIRLSQLYDPDKCLYQPVKKNTPIEPGKTYYSPEVRNKTVFFDAVDLSDRVGGEFAYDGEFYYKKDGVDTQEGKYVPSPQTLVVVDEINEFGQYTILVVDWVEDANEEKDKILKSKLDTLSESEKEAFLLTYVPTYRSHLKPINFTGGVDQATRAVDYNNDQMMLYIEDVTDPNNSHDRFQRLVPDRKLMMYGPRPLSYVLKQVVGGEEVVISTNSFLGSRSDHEEMGYFVTACGNNVIVKDLETFVALSGKTVEYYDSNGVRRQKTVVIERNPSTSELTPSTQQLFNDLLDCYNDGRYVTVITNSDDLLTQVQIPVPCYLRNSILALTSGQLVTMEIYEINESDASKRLITSVLLHTRAGQTLDLANDSRTVVGFDVRVRETDSDIIYVPVGVSSVTLTPYLKFDDGSTQLIDINDPDWINMTDAYELTTGLYAYGLTQLRNTQSVNAEFDILFKYYPAIAAGVSSTGGIDTRYVKTSDTTPSPLKQYFVKSVNDGNVSWNLATETGYFEDGSSFEAGVEYYEKKMSMAWGGVVSRPTNSFLSVRKRIKLVEGLSGSSSSLRHISTIPVWNSETNSYDFKFLVYDKSYEAPKLIGVDESDNGYILGADPLPFNIDLSGQDENTSDVYTAVLSYKPSKSVPAWATSRTVMVEVRDMSRHSDFGSSNRNGFERFLIGGRGTSSTGGWESGTIPYGRANASQSVKNTNGEAAFGNRPRLDCWTEDVNGVTVAKFQIHVDQIYGFPNFPEAPADNQYNWFYWQFYRAALDADDAWEVNVTPNCFRLRAAEPGEVTKMIDGVATKVTVPADEICSDYIPMVSNSDNEIMPYASAFECEGIRVPTRFDADAGTIYLPTIAIVEFAYKSNGVVKSLLGVPVEIVRIDHDPAEIIL